MNTAPTLRRLLVVFLIFLLPRGIHAEIAAANPLASYAELQHRVRETLALGRERTADAVERERVRTNWEVGKLIHEHILLHKDRADYGERVLRRLSADIGISLTEIQYMLEFARAYPIYPSTGKLSWSHYRELLSINDVEKRTEIAERASHNDWSEKELRREIRRLRNKDRTGIALATDELLIPLRGNLDTYRVVTAVAGKWQGKPVIDLGFSNFYHPSGNFPFHEGDIIHIKNGKLELAKEASQSLQPLQIMSYRAYVLDITDGDTLWVLIDLGFGITTKQHVRLRGIDAPEITSRDGQAAKRFVEKELSWAVGNGPGYVIITSTKSDKYDRYLADLFYGRAGKEIYLNQELLAKGYAVRVKE